MHLKMMKIKLLQMLGNLILSKKEKIFQYSSNQYSDNKSANAEEKRETQTKLRLDK